MASSLTPKNAEFEALFGKRASHIKPGLERIARSYEVLKKPAHRIPCVLIGGTNGKGSTAGFLWQMLSLAGLKVGLYSSPHLVSFSERYTVSGQSIDDTQIAARLKQLRAKLPRELYEELSFFEVATLLALTLFEDEQTDFNIFEVGLGGRWDATNILDPVTSLITSIGFDHEEYLGDSLVKIASEKAGIMRGARPTFLGRGITENPNTDVLKVFEAKAAELGASIEAYGINFGLNKAMLWVGDEQSSLPELRGASYLQENFVLAAAAFSWLRKKLSLRPIDFSATASYILPPSLLARFQQVLVRGASPVQDRQLFLDVCHNTEGVQRFCQEISELQTRQGFTGKFPAFVSILADKRIEPMLDILQGFFDPIVLFKINHERSMKQLKHKGSSQDEPLKLFECFAAAWEHALGSWPAKKPWVVCGSLMAVGEVIEYFSARPETSTMGSPLIGRTPNERP